MRSAGHFFGAVKEEYSASIVLFFRAEWVFEAALVICGSSPFCSAKTLHFSSSASCVTRTRVSLMVYDDLQVAAL